MGIVGLHLQTKLRAMKFLHSYAIYETICITTDFLSFAGRKRWLSITSYSSLKTKLLNSHSSISGAVSVQTENVCEISGCMMYTSSEVGGRCVIVAATQDYISVIHYSNSRHTFSTVQVSMYYNFCMNLYAVLTADWLKLIRFNC